MGYIHKYPGAAGVCKKIIAGKAGHFTGFMWICPAFFLFFVETIRNPDVKDMYKTKKER